MKEIEKDKKNPENLCISLLSRMKKHLCLEIAPVRAVENPAPGRFLHFPVTKTPHFLPEKSTKFTVVSTTPQVFKFCLFLFSMKFLYELVFSLLTQS